MIETALRLNLGSGQYPRAGYVNVDAYTDADVQGDLFDLEFTDAVDVRMEHLLEHISWRRTDEALSRVYGWLRVGGRFVVEVPDMDAVLMLGTRHPLWFKYVYGDQSHGGEYHLAGFTAEMLEGALVRAGFLRVVVDRLVSTHPGREGMPCLRGVAYA